MVTLDIHPEGKEFEAKVNSHAVSIPFSTLSIIVDDFRVTLFAKEEDALKLIRAARLLNEVFAKEGEQVE